MFNSGRNATLSCLTFDQTLSLDCTNRDRYDRHQNSSYNTCPAVNFSPWDRSSHNVLISVPTKSVQSRTNDIFELRPPSPRFPTILWNQTGMNIAWSISLCADLACFKSKNHAHEFSSYVSTPQKTIAKSDFSLSCPSGRTVYARLYVKRGQYRYSEGQLAEQVGA
jgi:hypothetical protein